MTWWSLACAAQGLVNGFRGLAFFRFNLGIGEGSSFPTAARRFQNGFQLKSVLQRLVYSIPDTFAESRDYDQLLDKYGMACQDILNAAKKVLRRK